ncbi:MAG: aminotransferase class I/II-fold pyridoxal phosphate-dependent enzyme [Candidatus Woesearchaeota archaeon]|jgi:aspartate/methionine/tyrosine aminotransferase|nr:aminotransferase class I/II-fold pyridoxal phosphate-dependent enzyme [Candidatus Woesearchaeota archaeon]
MTNPQAEELNETILNNNPAILEMLSDKGKAIFFPKKGILAQTAEAKGKKINATIGIALEEDSSPLCLNSISKNISLEPKDAFPYAPSFGKLELREQWKEMIIEKNPDLKSEISLPVVSNALTHGLSMVAYLFVNPGDKLIIPDLYWGNYNLILKNAYGAEFNTFELFKDNAFNIEGLKEELSKGKGTKVLLLNFPNNPTGYTPTEEEAREIVNAIKESARAGNNIVAIIDDAYFGLVYKEGIIKTSLFAELANLHKNILAIKLDGATKEDYAWGFRVGFITYGIKSGSKDLYEALEAKTAGAIRGNISNAPHLSQSLVLKAFTSPTYKEEKQEKYALLKKRAETVAEILENNKEYEECFTPLPFNSGYFMCVRLKEGLDGEKIRQILLEKYSTGLIAVGNLLRVAFSSCPTAQLEELFKNIYEACKEA